MRQRLTSLLQPFAALALALIIAGVVIWISGGQPIPAFTALLKGAFGDVNGILRTLAKATPLLFSGLAVAVALRAGLFNIGAEGQIVVGGLAAAWVGFAVKGLPIFIHLPLAMAAGALAGGIWGMIPGILKAWRGAHEVIVTIMMNYVAFELTRYLVLHYLVDPSKITNPNHAPKTPPILPSATLWSLPGPTNFSAGFVLALVAAAGIAFLIRRTSLGFEIRAVGLGAEAARTNGIPVGRTIVKAMAISGALAGLAGSVEVLGVHHKYLDAFSPGYGFDSIAVALLGGMNPAGIVLSSLLFGGLNSGAIYMESWTSTPRQIAGIVQAVVILAAGARYMRRSKQ